MPAGPKLVAGVSSGRLRRAESRLSVHVIDGDATRLGRSWKETEGMARWVEHDPDSTLWLMLGESGTDLDGPGGRGVKIIHGDV